MPEICHVQCTKIWSYGCCRQCSISWQLTVCKIVPDGHAWQKLQRVCRGQVQQEPHKYKKEALVFLVCHVLKLYWKNHDGHVNGTLPVVPLPGIQCFGAASACVDCEISDTVFIKKKKKFNIACGTIEGNPRIEVKEIGGLEISPCLR